MLSPYSRVGLFEALRPPPGSVVDAAVGTSFTLDLEALLTAPIAFALFEASDTDRDECGLEPVGLLEAIRRHSRPRHRLQSSRSNRRPGSSSHCVRLD